jgi:hypothetical protein
MPEIQAEKCINRLECPGADSAALKIYRSDTSNKLFRGLR